MYQSLIQIFGKWLIDETSHSPKNAGSLVHLFYDLVYVVQVSINMDPQIFKCLDLFYTFLSIPNY